MQTVELVRASFMRLLAPVVLMGSMLSPVSAQAADDGVILVSDFGLPGIRIFDPGTNKIVFDYLAEQTSIRGCNLDTVFCSPIGGTYTRHGNEDFIDVAMSIYDRRPQRPSNVKYSTEIQRIKIGTTPQLIWSIKNLDFSGIPDGLVYCDPNKRGGDTRCTPQLVHSIQIMDDRPADKIVTLVMAEMYNHRITQVTLDYNKNNTVAKVDWVLGKNSPDWPDNANPNGLQVLTDEPGGPYLVTTFYSDGLEQNYGSSVMAWRWVNGAWQLMWSFPEDVTSSVEKLHTPHLAEILFDPIDHTPWFVYSHSRGTAGDWGTYDEYGGSFGIARMSGGLTVRPSYMMDAVMYPDDAERQTHFSRDVDWLPDGTWLMADAACESGTCPWPSRLFKVEPLYDLPTSTTRPGAYAPDQSLINKVAIPNERIYEEYQCGLKTLYEVQFIARAEMGATLAGLRNSSTTMCPPAE
ncbi:MAG: hypothetical protein ACKO6N_22975 [Myxococcota bacterium]